MFYFVKFSGRNFSYGALWLVSQPVFTNIEWNVNDFFTYSFRKFISHVKALTFKRKISKVLFQNRIFKYIFNVKGASVSYFASSALNCRFSICKQSIWHVRIDWWNVGLFNCLDQGAHDLHMVSQMPLPSCQSLASFKSRSYFLPFWCQITHVLLESRPLNGFCLSVSLKFWLRSHC